MQTIMILCGGESGEHEVSLQSANSIIKFIPQDRYQTIAVGISKTGEWLTGDPLFENENDPSRICLSPNLVPTKFENRQVNGQLIDVVFPIIHGTYGEDGCIQGLLQLQHIPYVGSGVLGSSVGMDKDIMKRLFLHAGMNCAKHIVMYRWQMTKPTYSEVATELGEVLFVKPCNLGSSVGISKVTNNDEFKKAIDLALSYDNKILVEECIQGREIEISVLGNDVTEVSVPGEIIPETGFYSYDAKYIDSETTRLEIPAKLEAETIDEIGDMAKVSFRLLELSGLARVDFFVQENGKIWINEVNTLPGFTNISMYPKLWSACGLPYSELIHRLIQLAVERSNREEALIRNR